LVEQCSPEGRTVCCVPGASIALCSTVGKRRRIDVNRCRNEGGRGAHDGGSIWHAERTPPEFAVTRRTWRRPMRAKVCHIAAPRSRRDDLFVGLRLRATCARRERCKRSTMPDFRQRCKNSGSLNRQGRSDPRARCSALRVADAGATRSRRCRASRDMLCEGELARLYIMSSQGDVACRLGHRSLRELLDTAERLLPLSAARAGTGRV